MDFLDPRKERRNRIALFTGYGLVALAITIASIVLLYQTDGYCVDGHGAVDRCGLVFLSTQPAGSSIYVDNKLMPNQTNSKLNLQSGTYAIRLSQAGYRDWQRSVTVAGGDVQRFDYPFLIPSTLKPAKVTDYAAMPSILSQSPNRRWLLSMETEDVQSGKFTVYDLRNAAKPLIAQSIVPASLLTAGDGPQSWKVVEWADDNRSVLLEHGFTAAGVAGGEYVVFDRQTPDTSRNISRDLVLSPSEQVSFFNKQKTEFYVYNTESKALRAVAVDGSQLLAMPIEHVIAYKTYSDDTILYVTDTPPSGKATAGLVSVVLQQSNRSLIVRQLPAQATRYDIDITRYSGDWYALVGADSEKGIHVYKNPFDQKLQNSRSFPVPSHFLRLANPTYVAFSATARMVVVQNGQNFTVHDFDTDQTFPYAMTLPLDKPQEHATWMDGNRLYYVSGGKAVLFDYDMQNIQTLQAASPEWPLFFSVDYKYVFQLAPGATGFQLSRTALQAQ